MKGIVEGYGGAVAVDAGKETGIRGREVGDGEADSIAWIGLVGGFRVICIWEGRGNIPSHIY